MAKTPEEGRFADTAEHQLIAVFETHERARAARDRLVDEGIPSSEMDILNREETTGVTDAQTTAGVWTALRRFFIPQGEAYGYAEGVNRGHAVLAVRPRFEERERIVQILESFEPIDFDAQLEEWRAEGWAAGPHAAMPAEEDGLFGRRADDLRSARVRGYVRDRPAPRP